MTFSVLAYRAFGGRYDPLIYLDMWPVIPAFIVLNAMFRLYHGRVFYPAAPLPPVEEFRRLVGSALLLHLGLVAFLAFARQTTVGYSRVVFAMSGIMSAFFAQIVRDLCRRLLRRLGVGQIPVAIVGSGHVARRMAAIISRDTYTGFRPIGFFDDAQVKLGDLPRLGGLRKVVKKCRKHGVRILFACVDERLFRCQLASYTEWFTHIEYFPTDRVFPVFGSQIVAMDGIGGIEMVNQSRMPSLRFEKWLLDKSLAIVAFVFTFPLLLAIGALVMLTSPGGAFFRHERLGRGGKPIRIWKFRTMYRNADRRLEELLSKDPKAAAEWAAKFKLRHDPRVTPFGRFLRKTSLDELPQIFNVLGGSMALVGPRPIVQDEVKFYGSSYAIFASVKPGVTGLWQISGRSDVGYDRRVALDAYYVLNWSPWLDLWVLLHTVSAVLVCRGAR